MEDAGRVSGVKRAGQALEDDQHLRQQHGAAVQAVGQRPAGQVALYHEELVCLVPKVQQRNKAGVVEAGQALERALEAVGEIRTGRIFGRQQLDSHLPARGGVAGQVNVGGRALPQVAEQPVAANHDGGHTPHCSGVTQRGNLDNGAIA